MLVLTAVFQMETTSFSSRSGLKVPVRFAMQASSCLSSRKDLKVSFSLWVRQIIILSVWRTAGFPNALTFGRQCWQAMTLCASTPEMTLQLEARQYSLGYLWWYQTTMWATVGPHCQQHPNRGCGLLKAELSQLYRSPLPSQL